MQSSQTCAAFLHTLLVQCIGTVMIEWEQWNFPPPSFDRGYFNSRLKQQAPVNALTHKRLMRLFESVFHPDTRSQNSRYQEPQAVEAANALIALIDQCFHTDLSVWHNGYTRDNAPSRSHLLTCLDKILSIMEGQEFLPDQEIKEALDSYMDSVKSHVDIPVSEYPELLTPAPYHQTEHYIGRAAITETILGHLLAGESCYLHGIGGIGKTEIAKSVLQKILDMPSAQSGITHIMWVDYTEGDFALSLVRSLKLESSTHNLDDAFQKAIHLINQYRDKLLLFVDNVEEADDEKLLELTQYLNCRVLATSRCKGFAGLTEITVPPLSTDECMELFYAYYHGQKDDITLYKIIELADRHTVTVELLAKIADSEELLLHEFYSSLVRCGFNISEEEVTSSHEKMHSEGRVIEQLAKLFQVYGCTPDEERLLIQVSTIPNIHFSFDQAKKWFDLKNRTPLNHLVKRGWLKREALYDNGRNRYLYFIHSVIASAIRAQFLDRLYRECEGFIREITVEMQASKDENDAVKKELIQFSWSLNDIFQGQFHSESDCDFLWALAEIYRDIGYYERAIPLLDSLMTLYTEAFGEGCIQLGSVWNSKGMIDYELSHFESSLEDYQNSRKVVESHLFQDHPSSVTETDLAKLDLNIGRLYLKIDYLKAKPYLDRAYQTFLSKQGENDYLTLNALGNMAMYLFHDGHLQDAEKIFMEIYQKIPENTSDRQMLFLRADAAHHLGSLYSDTAPSKAMEYLIVARDIFWKYLSPTHPDTLDVLNSICSLRLTTESDYTQILSDFHQLLELFLKAYGPDDPNTGTVYNNIGLCYYYMKKPKDAIRNYEKAIWIDKLSYGENHEATAYIYNNLGAAYADDNQPEEAIAQHKLALQIYESVYPDHLNLDLALTHADLAETYLTLGDADATMDHLNKAFAIYDKMLPENAHQFLFPYSTLANLEVALGDNDTAISLYSHIIWLMFENGYAQNSPDVKQFEERIQELRAQTVSE